MDRIIYTYALIKTLYDLEEDYLECFLPFVIKSFSIEEILNSNAIQKKVKENSNLEIPIHVLNAILYRAMKRGFVKKEEKNYHITTEGQDYLDKSETEQEVNRRIKALIDDMKDFFIKQGNDLTYDEVQDLICSFICKNFKILLEFLNPKNHPKLKKKKFNDSETVLIDYISEAEKKKPEHYNTLRDMILGSLISVIIYSKKPSQLGIIKKNWSNCQIFFDTNFIFSLLGLHTSNFNEPAQELFKLLKTNGFELKIFDFTVDEISRVMNSYPKEGKRYPRSVKINTLYKNLNDKNWTKSDVIKFLTDLEDILNEKGIVIEPTDVNLSNYEPKDKGIENKLEGYKDFQNPRGQSHDLAAIYNIKNIRGKSIRKFEDSIALFLSSDVQLSKFNLKEMDHESQGTICEVILDRLLTNILWLNNPNAEISLKAIIESYSQDLFIKRRVWDKFFNELQELRQNEKINDEDVSMIFYHGQVESLLKEFNDDDIDKITHDFVLKGIEKAEKLKEKDVQEMEEKEKVFLDQLKNEKDYHENQIQKIKKSFRIASENESGKYASIITIVITISILGILIRALYEIYQYLKVSNDTIFLIATLSCIVIFLTFSGIPKYQGFSFKIHDYLKRMLCNRFYEKRLKEANLKV